MSTAPLWEAEAHGLPATTTPGVVLLLNSARPLLPAVPGPKVFFIPSLAAVMETARRIPLDAAGNLYGEARSGGAGTGCGPYGPCGAVFELTPPSTSGGSWSEATSYPFGSGSNGVEPVGGLIFGQFHRLYGVTQFSGSTMPHAKGMVFKLIP